MDLTILVSLSMLGEELGAAHPKVFVERQSHDHHTTRDDISQQSDTRQRACRVNLITVDDVFLPMLAPAQNPLQQEEQHSR